MALTMRKVAALQRDIQAIPIGTVICLATAALKFYTCWKTSGSDQCVRTLIADIEKCLKK